MFFRQSTWMMTATVVSGMLMALVHLLNKRVTDGDYAAFGTLIQLLQWLGIPAVGFQLVFAQLSASAVTERETRILATTARSVLAGVAVIWVMSAAVIFVLRDRLVAAWELPNAWPLWITLSISLLSLGLPVLVGILQGRQNFKWMGWVAIANGGGRLVFSYLIVFFIAATSVGIMAGALIGVIVSFAVAFWQTRSSLMGPGESGFGWRAWLARLAWLTLGYGGIFFMMSADVVIIRSSFSDEQFAPYIGAGVIARAIVQFTAPLAAVMFPKIVQSIVHTQKSDSLQLTLVGTLILGVCAAAGLMVVSPIVIKLGFKPSFASIAPLLPWYAWAMVPLALANVLISDLMARSRFVASPWLALVAAGYGITLWFYHPSFKQVILVLGGFNMLLTLVAGAFVWARRSGTSLKSTN